LIDGASLIGNVVVVDILEGVDGFTTTASEILVFTRNYDLRRNVNVRPSSLSLDLNSIGKC
jgi:hypothetical protein